MGKFMEYFNQAFPGLLKGLQESSSAEATKKAPADGHVAGDIPAPLAKPFSAYDMVHEIPKAHHASDHDAFLHAHIAHMMKTDTSVGAAQPQYLKEQIQEGGFLPARSYKHPRKFEEALHGSALSGFQGYQTHLSVYDIVPEIPENDDRAAVLARVQRDGSRLQHAPEKLRDDREIVLAALQDGGLNIRHASERLRDDREIVLAAVQENGDALEYASEKLKNDRKIVLAAVKERSGSFLHASKELKDDRDIVLTVVQQNGLSLQHASERMKNDRDIVLTAMQQDGGSFFHASEELQNDRDLAMKLLQRDVYYFPNLSEQMRGDRELAMYAVQRKASFLPAFPERLKDDRDVILAAVQREGYYLQYASERLRNDRDIVLAAVRQDGGSLSHASEGLKGDRDIVMATVQQDGRNLRHASEGIRGDREIVLAAVKQNAQAVQYAGPQLWNDRAFILAAAQKNGSVLAYLPAERQNDREIVLAAVQQEGTAISGASAELKHDRDVILAAVRQSAKAIQYVPEKMRNKRDIAMAIVQRDVTYFPKLSDDLRADRDVVLTAVQTNGQALEYASDNLRNDRGVVLTAVQKNWRAFKYASKALQDNRAWTLIAQQEQQRQSSRETQALNFLWLNLDLPAKPDPADGSMRVPMPEEYMENVRNAGRRHPHADIHLWVDSRRLTPRQLEYLEATVEDELPNVHVRDLCSIPEYANEELYSRTETRRNWRDGYRGVVWLQVDAAKILVSLQGDYDQRFFADLDHAHIDIESAEVQEMLNKYGLMIGGASENCHSMENQLWGFDRSRLDFFQDYYEEGLAGSYKGSIAYNALSPRVTSVLERFEHIRAEDACFPIGSIGLAHAEHPGHELSQGYKGRPVIPSQELQDVFNKRSRRERSSTADRKATPARGPALPV